MSIPLANGHQSGNSARYSLIQKIKSPSELFWSTGLFKRRFSPIAPGVPSKSFFSSGDKSGFEARSQSALSLVIWSRPVLFGWENCPTKSRSYHTKSSVNGTLCDQRSRSRCSNPFFNARSKISHLDYTFVRLNISSLLKFVSQSRYSTRGPSPLYVKDSESCTSFQFRPMEGTKTAFSEIINTI